MAKSVNKTLHVPCSDNLMPVLLIHVHTFKCIQNRTFFDFSKLRVYTDEKSIRRPSTCTHGLYERSSTR